VTVAAVVALVAASSRSRPVAAYLALRRVQVTTARSTGDQRGKAVFDEVVATEVERGSADLQRSLALACAESLTLLADEAADHRGAGRTSPSGQSASAKLAESLVAAQPRRSG
jgi:hypothetical protein